MHMHTHTHTHTHTCDDAAGQAGDPLDGGELAVGEEVVAGGVELRAVAEMFPYRRGYGAGGQGGRGGRDGGGVLYVRMKFTSFNHFFGSK